MATVTVNSTAALNTALIKAQAGDTILLASGTYSGVSGYAINPTGTVTITSQDPTHPAVLTNFVISNSSNLYFSHLDLSTVGSTDAYYGFKIGSSNNIQFDSVHVHGAIGSDPNAAITGFLITNSTQVSVTNSNFEYLQTGISQLNNDGLVFSGNSFSNVAADGIDGGGSSDVQILNNFFTTTAVDTIGLHPDAIQFWTYGTTTAAHDITISGNTYVRGDGAASQGIFMGNEADIPYLNVTITNNNILGAQYNGIAVGDVTNLVMSGNTVTPYTDQASWIRIEDSTGVALTNNAAGQYVFSNDLGLTEFGDSTVPQALSTAATVAAATAAMLAAPEFTQLYGANPNAYVTELYSLILDRTPDAQGLDYWVGQANAGQSAGQMLVDFVTSSESVQLIGTQSSTG